MGDALRAGSIRSTCPYCGVGCGVIASPAAAGVEITGDPEHPANFGRLCSKGSALARTIGLEGRLLTPRIIDKRNTDGVSSSEVSWNEALDCVAAGFARVIEEHGPESVALYVSGQLLTEDYYVANKFVKGWLGTANIDTNSRLCMASAVAGYKRAFGEDVVPCSFEDLEIADLVVLVGSNAAWCHPVIYQRILAAREKNPSARLVVIDPRHTPSCDEADLHLPITPGADGLLFNGLLAYLDRTGACDAGFIASTTEGIDEALAAAKKEGPVESIATGCGLNVDQLLQFYSLFAATTRVVTVFSQGINQSSSGTDKVNAIINCHLATGRIGIEGAGPFSMTGQPNAMGGREVGGLANALAAHMDLDDGAHRDIVQSFWASPRIASRPGLKAVDLFEAIGTGEIKAVWIIATNPVVSLPAADRVLAALRRCPFVVVSDCIADTDTARLADVLLPACAWGEKDGTVTNSERRISRQRAFLAPPGEARPDWFAICEVAKRLGATHGFDFESPAQIFAEHARLSARANGLAGQGRRYFDLSGLCALTPEEFDRLPPTRWPVTAQAHAFADFMAHRRARFIAFRARPPAHACSASYPLTLNSGRVRDQWHTMTRTGRAPQLNAHRPEPFIEIHPHDALAHGVKEGGLARVSSRWGAVVLKVRETADQRPGSIFAPIHWSDANASDARIGRVVNAIVDPISGEPEFKQTPVAVEPFAVDWHGFALAGSPLSLKQLTYWAESRGEAHWRYEFAGRGEPPDWRELVPGPGEWIDYSDAATGTFRAAKISRGRLLAAMFLASTTALPERTWLQSLFQAEALTPGDRLALLSGRSPEGKATGATVCACFGVGSSAIKREIDAGACSTQALGARLRAGTNCGSCLPELRRLIAQRDASAPAPGALAG